MFLMRIFINLLTSSRFLFQNHPICITVENSIVWRLKSSFIHQKPVHRFEQIRKRIDLLRELRKAEVFVGRENLWRINWENLFISAATRVLAVFTVIGRHTQKQFSANYDWSNIRRSSDNACGGESCRQIFDRKFHAMHRSATLFIIPLLCNLFIIPFSLFLSPQNGYTETKLRIPASISRVT